jgi:hypothetical protein
MNNTTVEFPLPQQEVAGFGGADRCDYWPRQIANLLLGVYIVPALSCGAPASRLIGEFN